MWSACNQKLYDRKISNNSRRTLLVTWAISKIATVLPTSGNKRKHSTSLPVYKTVFSSKNISNERVKKNISCRAVILSHVNPHLRWNQIHLQIRKKQTNHWTRYRACNSIRITHHDRNLVAAWAHGQQIVGVHGTVFKNQRTRYRDGSQHCVSISETRDKHPGWPLVLPSVSCAGTASRGPRPLFVASANERWMFSHRKFTSNSALPPSSFFFTESNYDKMMVDLY